LEPLRHGTPALAAFSYDVSKAESHHSRSYGIVDPLTK